MLSFLVCYATGEGQTEKVADRIVDVLETRGHEATATNAGDFPADLTVADFDAILIGASIHAGRHQSAAREFVRENRDELSRKPTAFFQVSLSSADEEGEAKAAGYVDEFVADTGWHPDRIGLFGGALRYSKYGFLKRLVMRQISKRTVPDAEERGTVEATGDVEFTDWLEVDAFAADVASFVEGRLGVLPPGVTGDADGASGE